MPSFSTRPSGYDCLATSNYHRTRGTLGIALIVLSTGLGPLAAHGKAIVSSARVTVSQVIELDGTPPVFRLPLEDAHGNRTTLIVYARPLSMRLAPDALLVSGAQQLPVQLTNERGRLSSFTPSIKCQGKPTELGCRSLRMPAGTIVRFVTKN